MKNRLEHKNMTIKNSLTNKTNTKYEQQYVLTFGWVAMVFFF